MIKYSIFLGLWTLAATAAINSSHNGTADTLAEQKFVPIVNSHMEKFQDGSYTYSYEGGDGSIRQETGIVNDDEDEGLEVYGIYTYLTPDGHRIAVKYTADKNGFHPEIFDEKSPRDPESGREAAQFVRQIAFKLLSKRVPGETLEEAD